MLILLLVKGGALPAQPTRGTRCTNHSPINLGAACAVIASLSLYIGTTNLTGPVRKCGMKLTEKAQVKCLQDIGFQGACTQIWMYNAANDKKKTADGGCLGICLRYATASANEPTVARVMGSNPCSPSECPNTINGPRLWIP